MNDPDVIHTLKRIEQLLAEQSCELLDREATARLLSVSPATLDRMRSAGKLPAAIDLNGGSMPRWSRRVLLTWIENNCE